MSRIKQLEAEIEGLKSEIESLKVNRRLLAARIREVEEYIDTVSSPLWRRMWFVLQGWRFNRLGRWYKAPWNEAGKRWD